MSGLREGRAVSAAFSDPLTPGTWVLAWPGSRQGEPLVTRTRSEVWAVHSGERVVAVEGYAGGIALTHVDVLPVAEDETPATPDWRERAEYLEDLAEALDDLVMSKGVALDEERLDWLTDWIADRLAAARREGADAALAPVVTYGQHCAILRMEPSTRGLADAIAEGRDAAKDGAS